MRQPADFEINQYVALQNAVVENEVHVQVFILEAQPLLARDEGKTLAQLEKEFLEMRDDGRLDL